MTWTRTRFAPPLLALALAFSAFSGPAAAACLSPDEARPLVSSGQVMPLSAALSRAGITGQPVRVALCESGGGYVYQVAILSPGGAVQTVTLPAN